MFAHLKRVREMEFDRESNSGSSDPSPSSKGASNPLKIPGFTRADELLDEKERLIAEISTPLSLPKSPRSTTKTNKEIKLLPMQPIAEKGEVNPETEVPKPE